jgi:hypothetical protein
MKTAKLMAVFAITGLIAPSAMAAAPAASTALASAPVASMGNGARLGVASNGRSSKMTHGSAVALGLVGAAAVGVGIAAAAGAFDKHHHHNSASN